MEEYFDEETGVSLTVERDVLEAPWIRVTAIGMDMTAERLNDAVQRLMARVFLPPEQKAGEHDG